eukprot:2061752-Amphidinium_carterae.1
MDGAHLLHLNQLAFLYCWEKSCRSPFQSTAVVESESVTSDRLLKLWLASLTIQVDVCKARNQIEQPRSIH